jgi:uncharacterized protein (TIGR00369 family)
MYEDFDIPEADFAMIMGTPHMQALGAEFVSARQGKGALRIPWREDLIGDPDTGVIAGGVVTALLDHVGGLAIRTASREGFMVATLDLRIDYMRPAAPRAGVTCEAVCYKVTRSVGFVRAQAWDTDPSDPVATAQASFMLNPRG